MDENTLGGQDVAKKRFPLLFLVHRGETFSKEHAEQSRKCKKYVVPVSCSCSYN